MASTTANSTRGTGSLILTGLLLAFVGVSAMAQTQSAPGDDQSGGVSAYLSLRPPADVDRDAGNAKAAVPYLSIAPKEYAGEFNPAYASYQYDWTDLYDLSSQIAYAISKIYTARDRRIPANLVSEAPAPVEKGPLAGLPHAGGNNGSTARPDPAILRALSR